MKTALRSVAAEPSEVAGDIAGDALERRIVRLTVLGFAAYCLFLLALKWFGFSAAVFDHAKEIYHAQELRWVYDAANPPLYTWLLYGLQQVFGVRLVTVLLLNALLLFLIFLASFVLARRVLGSPMQAALAAWSLMLVGQYHKLIYTMSHSLLAAIFCPLMLWAMVRIADERRLTHYLVAGVVVGLGLLSKFLFLAAFIAVVIGALCLRSARPSVLNPKFLLTLGVGSAIFAPFVIASQDQWSRLTAVLRTRTGADLSESYLAGVGNGIWDLVRNFGEYGGALAVAVVAAIIWAARSRSEAAGGRAASASNPDALNLVGATMLAALGFILAAVLFANVSVIKPRFMHIFFFALPILAVALAASRPAGARALQAYAAVLTVIGAGILGVRVINTTPVCLNRCDDLTPYDALSRKLAAAGFERGTIFAYGVRLGGNMVLSFPRARVDVAIDPFVPAATAAGQRGACLVVWERGDVPNGQVPPNLIKAAGITSEQARASMRSIRVDWQWHGLPVLDHGKNWRPRATTWDYILLSEGTKTCR